MKAPAAAEAGAAGAEVTTWYALGAGGNAAEESSRMLASFATFAQRSFSRPTKAAISAGVAAPAVAPAEAHAFLSSGDASALATSDTIRSTI